MGQFAFKVFVNLVIWSVGSFVAGMHIIGRAPEECMPDIYQSPMWMEVARCDFQNASDLWGQLDLNGVISQFAPILLAFFLAGMLSFCRALSKKVSKTVSDEAAGVSMSLGSISLVVACGAALSRWSPEDGLIPELPYLISGIVAAGLLYLFSYLISRP